MTIGVVKLQKGYKKYHVFLVVICKNISFCGSLKISFIFAHTQTQSILMSLLAQHISMHQVLICASTMRLEVRWTVASILPHSSWSLYALFRKFCLFSIRKKVIWVWNEMRVSKRRQNFHFWMNYPFKSHSQSL